MNQTLLLLITLIHTIKSCSPGQRLVVALALLALILIQILSLI